MHSTRPQFNKAHYQNQYKPSTYMNTWRLSNTLLNNEWVKEETKKEIKAFLELSKNDNTT